MFWIVRAIQEKSQICLKCVPLGSKNKIQTESTLWRDSSAPAVLLFLQDRGKQRSLFISLFSKEGEVHVCVPAYSLEKVQAYSDAILRPHPPPCVWIQEYSWSRYVLSSRPTEQHVAPRILAVKQPLSHSALSLYPKCCFETALGLDLYYPLMRCH